MLPPSRFALLALGLLFFAAGCDSSSDDGEESPQDLTGVWREAVGNDDDDFTEYAVITEDRVDFYVEGLYRGTCWIVAEWTILESDGSAYVMQNDSGAQTTFSIVREGERLTVEDVEYVEASRTAGEVRNLYPLCPQSR